MKIVLIVAGVLVAVMLVAAMIASFTSKKSSSSKTNTTQTSSTSDERIKYTLKLNSAQFQPNTPQDIKFSILNQTGEVQKSFVQKDTKLAYVYLLRTDINKLIVLEPEYDSVSGEFSVKGFNFGADANYRMFISFKAQQMRDTLFEQHEITIKTDINVGNKALYKVEAFGDVRASDIVDGVTINTDGWREGKNLNRNMVLSLNKDGAPFKNTKPFNQHQARVYAFKQGSMDFAFVNSEQISYDAATGNINYNILFPKEGIYKIFVELNINDKRQMATFVVDVKDLK